MKASRSKNISRDDQDPTGNGTSSLSATPVTTVPLLDLKEQYRAIKDEIQRAIQGVIETQQFILGPEVEAFENEIADYCGTTSAIGVSSGTDALLVSLMALGIGEGDEVITTPFTFFATIGSILRVGAKVVFADIQPDTFNIDPFAAEKAITQRTKALIPVHLFGQSADMDPLLALAKQHGFSIIEDAAQAIGASYKGRPIGSMGTVGCFSFFPSKNLGGFGDGGMITTSDPALDDRMRVLRNQGSRPKYHHPILGGNFRLDALQAAILRVKLKHLETWTQKRRENADYYTQRFHELGLVPENIIPPSSLHERHVYNQYVIKLQKRDDIKSFLQTKGVTTEIYYFEPAHIQECLSKNSYRLGDFPVCEHACSTVLALPIYPELTMEQKEYVVSLFAEFYGK